MMAYECLVELFSEFKASWHPLGTSGIFICWEDTVYALMAGSRTLSKEVFHSKL